MDCLARKVVDTTREERGQLHPLPLVLLIILGRLQLKVVFVVRSDHELLRSEIGVVAATRICDGRFVLRYLLITHFLYTQMVFIKIGFGLWVVLLFI